MQRVEITLFQIIEVLKPQVTKIVNELAAEKIEQQHKVSYIYVFFFFK